MSPRTEPTPYDVLIIGAGQGGLPLASAMAEGGHRVALIERAYLGGTCVNWGCTPTKTLIAAARVAHVARRASEYGIHTGPVEVDFAAVMARVNRIVGTWREGQQQTVAQHDRIDLVRGHGTFVAPRVVRVGRQALTAPRIVIDTGSHSAIPAIEGLDAVPYLTNRTLLQLDDRPDHLIILGGSYLGLEFGQLFARLGSRVTILESNRQVAPREDPDIAEALRTVLEGEGIEIMTGAATKRAGTQGAGVALEVVSDRGGRTVQGSHLLVAVGRTPNTAELGCPAAGIELDEAGYVAVDERLRTTAEGVWAIGDVKGGPAFTHVSYDDHRIVLDQWLGEGKASTAGRLVPYALYTDPELGRVGLTERQAREKGYSVRVGSRPLEEVGRAVERGETAGCYKLVVDEATDRLLGAAVLAPEGGELVHMFVTLMETGAPVTALRDALFIHPTLAEGFSTLLDQVAEPA